jgi:DNA modification methylase
VTKTGSSQGELRIEHLPIDDLRPDPANPRKIGDAELESLVRSIREFGLVQPVLARREGRTVVGGHQRLLAARKLGLKTVPVILLDISVEQARLLNLALNRISGEWDQDLLARLLSDLQSSPDIDLALSGFADDEIGQLLKKLERRERRERVEHFDLDEALEQAQREPRTRTGDVWLLGDHRLICGDSTEASIVGHLLGSERPQMCFTDPPYGVSLGNHGGQQRGARRRRIANDSLPRVQWEAFCRSWAQNLVVNVDGAIYVCMSTKEWPTVSRVLEEVGAHWSDTVIWAKDRFTLGRADYQRQYEPIWFGWREGAKHHWCGDRDQGDIWNIPRPSESDAHPTMKPLALVERALTNSSREGDRVLDLFLGSGSTIMAAERAGRICLGVELDPLYCDVIVARWEAFTGEEARLETPR